MRFFCFRSSTDMDFKHRMQRGQTFYGIHGMVALEEGTDFKNRIN